jgi:hypothetical protein
VIVAHVGGVPVEETLLQLAPAGAAIVSCVAVLARSTAGRIVGRLRHRRAGGTKDSWSVGSSPTRPADRWGADA